MPKGLERQVCVLAESSCATDRIIGLYSGFVRVHANARVITNTTASANCPVGVGSLWSNISFKNTSGYSIDDTDKHFVDDKVAKRSPGCFPIIISNATTPKL